MTDKLENISLPIQIRLRSIDVLIDAYGYVNRETLAELNGLKVAAIASDLSAYKALNPDSIHYNRQTQRIEKLSSFKRVFK